MADNLIGNMFAVDPNQLAQQRYDAQRQSALQYAQLDPFQRANMGMYQAGGNIVGAGAGMMGGKKAIPDALQVWKNSTQEHWCPGKSPEYL